MNNAERVNEEQWQTCRYDHPWVNLIHEVSMETLLRSPHMMSNTHMKKS